MAEHKSVEPHLFESHSAHPERRVVIFQVWKELKREHGPRCWRAVERQINRQFSWSTSRKVVKSTVERCLELKSYRDRPMRRPGQAKVTPRIRTMLVKAATNIKVARHLRSVRQLAKKRWCGVKLSHMAVQNVLKEAGLRWLRSGTRPYSSVHHDRMRKEFARIGKGLSIEGWLAMYFIDETHFETIHRPNRRNTGEWCVAGFTPEADMTVKHPGRVNGAMGISGHGVSPVHLYRGRFNAEVFAIHITDVYAPDMARHDDITTLMMDNDPSHHSRRAVTTCAEVGILKCNSPPPPCWRMTCTCPLPEWPWFPAYCPALSPLEIHFNDLQQRLDNLSERLGQVKKLADLERRVRKVHKETSAVYVRKLYESMAARCQSMFDNNGQRCLY